jgi:hypothetical protein
MKSKDVLKVVAMSLCAALLVLPKVTPAKAGTNQVSIAPVTSDAESDLINFHQHDNRLPTSGFDWDPPPAGCHYTGNSACGGSQNNTCPNKNQRYFTWSCDNGTQGAGCRHDTACD